MNAEKLYKAIESWSLETFTNSSEKEQLGKLLKEAVEAMSSPGDISEYADCIICLIGAAARAGYTFEQLLQATSDKFDINKLRDWTRKEDGEYQHKSAGEKPFTITEPNKFTY